MLFIFVLYAPSVRGQSVSSFLPKKIKQTDTYLFYLHGGVVTVLGNNAINQSMPEWGPYEYLNILDTLRSYGFNIISENRKVGIDDSLYANKLSNQIDTLLHNGVRPDNIIVIAASAGTVIAIHASVKLKHAELKYVLMGGCWPDDYKNYQGMNLYGRFLSVIESSDPHGTCNKIFEHSQTIKSYEEITLHTGFSHAFFYKARKEWIDPVIKWFKDK